MAEAPISGQWSPKSRGRPRPTLSRVRKDYRQRTSGDRLFRGARDLSGFAVRAASADRNTRPIRCDGPRRRWRRFRTGRGDSPRHRRALVRSDEDLRPTLKRAQLLTRDARVKERKKVGLKRARKAPQYTKR